MATARNQESVVVKLVGKERLVQNVIPIQGVRMVHAKDHGSAIVNQAGEVCSAMKS